MLNLKNILGYWLDKNVHQKFEFIRRQDLIFAIIPHNTVTITAPALKTEYENWGTKWIDSTDDKVLIDYQIEQNVKAKIRFVNICLEDCSNLPQEILSWPAADQEGFILGRQGYVLLTDNFGHLRKKASNWSIPCFGGIDILAANILKGSLNLSVADEFYKLWRRQDLEWTHPEFPEFPELYQIIDKENLKHYFEV